jgi:hypothetical protein
MPLKLHPRTRVLAVKGPAEQADLRLAEERFGHLPDDYTSIVQEATELELEFENGRYFRVWGPSGCVEMDEGYEIAAQVPGAIPIGDDGGGQFIYYGDGGRGWGLYCMDYGDIDPKEGVWIAVSLEDFLAHQEGSERLP